MTSDKSLPRQAVLEDTGRSRGWQSMVKEAEVELERWVERRRHLRKRGRNSGTTDRRAGSVANRDGQPGGGRSD